MSETLIVVAFLLALFVGLPVAILKGRDLLARQGEGSRSARVAALGNMLMGGLALLIGVSIALWVAYNLLVERQPQFQGGTGLGAYLVPVALILVGWRWLRRPDVPIPPASITPADPEEHP
jgi:UDP-N-acetylmuramyl pentapeptide phosphotransferase/UDP-N-acetylglucosamine-1-phosphate transferase